MIIYTHPKHAHVQEVDPRETVRMQLLERAGWSAKKDAPTSPPAVEADSTDASAVTVHHVFDAKLADLLSAAGFPLASQVNDAPDSILLKISGIGPAKLVQIREALGG